MPNVDKNRKSWTEKGIYEQNVKTVAERKKLKPPLLTE